MSRTIVHRHGVLQQQARHRLQIKRTNQLLAGTQ
jgi:hypothetical protein